MFVATTKKERNNQPTRYSPFYRFQPWIHHPIMCRLLLHAKAKVKLLVLLGMLQLLVSRTLQRNSRLETSMSASPSRRKRSESEWTKIRMTSSQQTLTPVRRSLTVQGQSLLEALRKRRRSLWSVPTGQSENISAREIPTDASARFVVKGLWWPCSSASNTKNVMLLHSFTWEPCTCMVPMSRTSKTETVVIVICLHATKLSFHFRKIKPRFLLKSHSHSFKFLSFLFGYV
jgi:hypothetical protein